MELWFPVVRAPLKVAEIHSETERRKRLMFDDTITKKLGDPVSTLETLPAQNFVPYSEGELDPPLVIDEDLVTSTEDAAFEKPMTDLLINTESSLLQGEMTKPSKAIGRTQDVHDNIIGTYDTNPLLNTMIYDV